MAKEAANKDIETMEKVLKEHEEALAEKEKFMNDKIAELMEKEKFTDERAEDLDKREQALAKVGPAKTASKEQKKELSQKDLKLIEAGCKAFGIDMEYVLNARVDEEGLAVIVTHGGAKVKYAQGDEKAKGFEPLDPIRVDGIIRKKPRHLIGKKKD